MRHATCQCTLLKMLFASLPGCSGLVRRKIEGGKRITYTLVETMVRVIDGATYEGQL